MKYWFYKIVAKIASYFTWTGPADGDTGPDDAITEDPLD